MNSEQDPLIKITEKNNVVELHKKRNKLERRQSWGQSSTNSVSVLSPRVDNHRQTATKGGQKNGDIEGIIVGSEVVGTPDPKRSGAKPRKILNKAIIKMPPGTLDNTKGKKKKND